MDSGKREKKKRSSPAPRAGSADALQEMEALTGERPGEAGGVFELVWPSWRGKRMGMEELRRASAELRELLEGEVLDRERLAGLRVPAVMTGEVVGRGGGEAGEQVAFADGEFRAEGYGYLCLEEEQLSVAVPVWIDPQGMEAHWLLLDEEAQPVTTEMVLARLEDLGVVEGIEEDVIVAVCARARGGEQACGAERIAAGVFPEDGEDVRIEILVDTQQTAGEKREDGSIDFKEVNFASNVRQGQLIARRIPPIPGVPGRDVRGGTLAAVGELDRPLKPGENVEVRREEGIELFYATVSGALREHGDEIGVTKLLRIQGGVDFKTGNLDFDGEVCVEGSVVQGFAVKATGDITITDTVEPGATVTAGRNLTVGRGIVGRKTKVTAEGNVRAQFVQEGMVTAGRDILLGSYAYQARLRAGRRMIVSRGEGTRGGSLAGGQTWALNAIDVCFLGSENHTPTALMAGVNPQHIRKLDGLKESVDASFTQLRRLLSQFGLARVDVAQIKNMIAAAVGPRRKLLAGKAQKLGQVVQIYQKQLLARQQLEKQIAEEMQGAEIRAQDQAFPGVFLQLGEHRLKLTEAVASPCFHVVDGHLVER
jgi:uncharacterized protein